MLSLFWAFFQKIFFLITVIAVSVLSLSEKLTLRLWIWAEVWVFINEELELLDTDRDVDHDADCLSWETTAVSCNIWSSCQAFVTNNFILSQLTTLIVSDITTELLFAIIVNTWTIIFIDVSSSISDAENYCMTFRKKDCTHLFFSQHFRRTESMMNSLACFWMLQLSRCLNENCKRDHVRKKKNDCNVLS